MLNFKAEKTSVLPNVLLFPGGILQFERRFRKRRLGIKEVGE